MKTSLKDSKPKIREPQNSFQLKFPYNTKHYFPSVKKLWPFHFLSNSNRDFFNLCENSPMPILILSDFTANKVIYINKALVKIIGYEEVSFKNFHLHVIVHPDHINIIKEHSLKRINGNHDPIEYQIKLIHQNKSIIWANIHSSVIKFKGKYRTLIVAKDITKEKEINEKLINTKNTFQSLFIESPTINLVLNERDGWVLCANKAAQVFFNYSVEELTDKSIYDLLADNEISLNKLKSEHTHTLDHKLKNGKIKHSEVSLKTIELQDKTVILYSIRDITIQKSIEKALIESETKYKAIVDNSYDGIYIYRDNNILFANKRIFELSGYSPRVFAETNFWDIIHPDDRPRIMSYAKSKAEGKTTSESYIGRVICKGGQIKECEFSVTTIKYFDEYAVLGVVRDISKKLDQRKD